MQVIVQRFSYVISPIASAIKSRDGAKAVRTFLISSCKYSVAITLPPTLVLVVFGDTILGIWMGKQYITNITLMILAAGYFFPTALSSAQSIIVGMNRHGKIGVINLVITLVAFIILGVSWKNWTLLKFATLIVIPILLGNGLTVPIYTFKVLNVPILRSINNILLIPLVCNLPMLLSLTLTKIMLASSPFFALILGVSIGGLISSLLYLFFVFPPKYREQIRAILSRKRGIQISSKTP